MAKYNELNKPQKALIDTNVALTISEVVATSAEVPSFVASQAYIDELRNKFSMRINQLEKIRYDTYIRAQDTGIDVNNPQEYIDRAIAIVKKLNVLNPNQSARSYQQSQKVANSSGSKVYFTASAGAH